MVNENVPIFRVKDSDSIGYLTPEQYKRLKARILITGKEFQHFGLLHVYGTRLELPKGAKAGSLMFGITIPGIEVKSMLIQAQLTAKMLEAETMAIEVEACIRGLM